MTSLVAAPLRALGPLAALLALSDVSDILVNGPGQVWVERAGRLEITDLALDAGEIQGIVERIVGPLGLRVDRSSPMVDARLADGSRVHVVVAPAAVDGPVVAVRRFAVAEVGLEAFGDSSMVSELVSAVQSRRNIVVVGSTGAGKTTLLNALVAHVDAGERIITIEDTAELRLPTPHVVRLEARTANAEGVGEITARQLLRSALRLRPDRIVVGEVRGVEAMDMIQALTTGHAGSLSTCHADSCRDGLRRLETMALGADLGLPLEAIRSQLDSAVDLMIHVRRGADGRRRIDEVVEVVGGTERVVARPGWS